MLHKKKQQQQKTKKKTLLRDGYSKTNGDIRKVFHLHLKVFMQNILMIYLNIIIWIYHLLYFNVTYNLFLDL